LCWMFIDPKKPVFEGDETREPVLAAT
jgi:hypothetical protein